MSIYVVNLPYQMTKEDLEEVCVNHAKVIQVQVITDREMGRRLGFSPLSKMDSKRKKMQ